MTPVDRFGSLNRERCRYPTRENSNFAAIDPPNNETYSRSWRLFSSRGFGTTVYVPFAQRLVQKCSFEFQARDDCRTQDRPTNGHDQPTATIGSRGTEPTQGGLMESTVAPGDPHDGQDDEIGSHVRGGGNRP